MVNFPAPQKLDPKISPHGIHTVYDSVCGAGNGQFSCPTKTRPQDITPWYSHYLWPCLWGRKRSIFLPHQKLDPKISPHGTHTIYDRVCGAGNGQFSCPTKTRPQAQNRGIFDVYAKPKATSVAKTPLFATLSQHNMSEMLYLKVFFDHPDHLLKNTGIYNVLWEHMHETP